MIFWSAREVQQGISAIGVSSEVVRTAFMLRVLTDEYLEYGNKRSFRQWQQYLARLGSILANKEAFGSIGQPFQADLEKRYQEVNSLAFKVMQAPSPQMDENHSEETKALKEALHNMMSLRLEQLAETANDLNITCQLSTLNRQNLAQRTIVIMGLLMVLIILINLYLLRKSVVAPLKELAGGAQAIGAGNFDYVVEIKSDDEVGKLAGAFNTMAGHLKKSYASLESEIMERKRAEVTATTERQRLYDVLETLPVYVCLLDSDYRMPFANRYFRETFGESKGRHCHEFLFNRTEPCEICETYTVMKTRAPHHWFWTGPNERDYDIYDFPFIDTDGSFLILEMGIDITERKRADEALKQTLVDLERSNADLEQFAYVASHDLQEPLRNVASCVQLLGKRYKGKFDADADQLLAYATESSVRMKALIVDLLAYSRINTRGNPFRPTSCEDVLQQTLAQLKPSIEAAGVAITHDPLPTVVGDFTQLGQVFQNLIGNAIKFRRDEPLHVHVSAAKRDGEWVFSVKDSGIGIDSRHLERIFVIFQRLHKRSEYEGTGMGLAIVKKIIERHHGTIWVESEPQKGTTFFFTIPAKETNT
jgi:signal transduction histidine kinase